MTRRAFMTALCVITAAKRVTAAVPTSGSIVPTSGTEGFIFTGRMTLGGLPEEGYYAVGQLLSFNLHPDAKGMRAGADALLDQDVEIVVRRSTRAERSVDTAAPHRHIER